MSAIKKSSTGITSWYFNFINLLQPSYFEHRLQPMGVVATPPELLTSRPNLVVKLFMGMFSGSRNPIEIVKFSISIA